MVGGILSLPQVQVDFKLPVAALRFATCPADAFPVDLTDKQCYGLSKSCLAIGHFRDPIDCPPKNQMNDFREKMTKQLR